MQEGSDRWRKDWRGDIRNYSGPPRKPGSLPWTSPRWHNKIIEKIETEYVAISPDTYKPETKGTFELFVFQRRILNAMLTTQPNIPLHRLKLPYNTGIWSAIKKSGKTAIGGGIGMAWARVYGGEILCIANDKDQARDRAFTRIRSYLEWLGTDQAGEYRDRIPTIPRQNEVVEDMTKDSITLHDPYCLIRAIPCDAAGEAGGFQSLTIWDELWAYNSENLFRLWTELQPIPTVQESFRLVVTYAGYYGESDLLYSMFDQTVKPDEHDEPQGQRVKGLEDLPCFENRDMFFYWDNIPRMPWHTKEFLLGARLDPGMMHRPHEYLRIWENRWTSGVEAFLEPALVEAAMARGAAMGYTNEFIGV